jgi:hypothetical protein
MDFHEFCALIGEKRTCLGQNQSLGAMKATRWSLSMLFNQWLMVQFKACVVSNEWMCSERDDPSSTNHLVHCKKEKKLTRKVPS